MSTDHQQNETGALQRARRLLDGWLTRAEVAAELGVSVDTLQRWDNQRLGPPCVRLGRKVLYRAEAFHDWLRCQEPGRIVGKRQRSGGAQ